MFALMSPHCLLLSKLSRLTFLDIPPWPTTHCWSTILLIMFTVAAVACLGGLKFQGMVLVVEPIQHFHSWMAFLCWLLVGQAFLLASLALSAFTSYLRLITQHLVCNPPCSWLALWPLVVSNSVVTDFYHVSKLSPVLVFLSCSPWVP